MNWIKRLFTPKTKAQKDAENYFAGIEYELKIKESPNRHRTLFDIKFGRPYNTGPMKENM